VISNERLVFPKDIIYESDEPTQITNPRRVANPASDQSVGTELTPTTLEPNVGNVLGGGAEVRLHT
jgi:hypothetical protein